MYIVDWTVSSSRTDLSTVLAPLGPFGDTICIDLITLIVDGTPSRAHLDLTFV